jgi:hypothetical protein
MKKISLSILFILMAATGHGQEYWGISFDNTQFLDRIEIDTVSNPNCLWQIGTPLKPILNAAYSIPRALVTDTLNPVPANDTSVFYLKHARDNITMPFHVFALHFLFQMDGDSTDFGTIEVSPDTGHTWINVLTQDSTYQMNWLTAKPSLRGSTNGWQNFDLDMMTWASALNWGGPILPIYMTADTILFRFTYITDSDSTPHDGWMIDEFYLEDWAEGIHENQRDNLISISPNPTSTQLRVHVLQPSENSRIQIMNHTGQVVYERSNSIDESIDVRQFPNGIYIVKYSDAKYFSVKRLIVQH